MFSETFLKIPQQEEQGKWGFVHPSANTCTGALQTIHMDHTRNAEITQGLQFKLTIAISHWQTHFAMPLFYFNREKNPNQSQPLSFFFLMGSVMRVKVWTDKQKHEHS